MKKINSSTLIFDSASCKISCEEMKDLRITTTTLTRARKNKALMRVLYSLTLRGSSEMRYRLVSISPLYSDSYKIILAKLKNKIVGWSMIFNNSDWIDNILMPQITAYFYVAHQFRRKGIGSALFDRVKKITNRKKRIIDVSPWDLRSTKFFKNVGAIK